MATTKPNTKPVKRKPVVKRSSTVKSKAVANRTAAKIEQAYTPLTWALLVVWLGLVAVFLGMVIVKIYLS